MNHHQIMRDVLQEAIALGPRPDGKCWHYVRDGLNVWVGRDRDMYIMAEWYTPASFGSDDLSCTGYRLPAEMGSTRHNITHRAASLRALEPLI
jgi:hypothetical protein